jgi:hypothetical protein
MTAVCGEIDEGKLPIVRDAIQEFFERYNVGKFVDDGMYIDDLAGGLYGGNVPITEIFGGTNK